MSRIEDIKTELDKLYKSREYVKKNRDLVFDYEASAQISRMGYYNDRKIEALEKELNKLEEDEDND